MQVMVQKQLSVAVRIYIWTFQSHEATLYIVNKGKATKLYGYVLNNVQKGSHKALSAHAHVRAKDHV